MESTHMLTVTLLRACSIRWSPSGPSYANLKHVVKSCMLSWRCVSVSVCKGEWRESVCERESGVRVCVRGRVE